MAEKKSEVNVYSIKGDVVKTVALPQVFHTLYRPDVIRKAVVAEEANRAGMPWNSPGAQAPRH